MPTPLPFPQDQLVAAISDHMDAVAKVVNWSIVLATVFWWAGVQGEAVIETQGLTIKREHALFVACGFFVFVNFYALDVFYRIGEILRNTEDQRFKEAATNLALHPWFANPFAFFDRSRISALMTGKGYGLLIIAWWYGNSSMLALTSDQFAPLALLMQGVFLAVGFASMGTIQRVQSIVYRRFAEIEPEVGSALKRVAPIRFLMTILGIGIGGIVAFGTQVLIFQ